MLMTTPRWLVVLTVCNLVLVMVALATRHPVVAQTVPSVLRGRSLEIVDEQGRVRASLQLLPPTRQANGEVSAETVLLRLITEKGRPSVKLAASEPASGASFVGPTGTKNTYVIVEAKGEVSTVTLKNEGGGTRAIT